jgi:trigger factor
VNQVAEAKLPPLDENLARALGVKDGSVEQLRREVRDNIEKEVAKRVQAAVKEQVMDRLHAAAGFEVPRALLEQEVARMQEQAVEDLKQRGMTTQNLTLPPDLFTERASRRIKLGLLVGELVKKEGLQARPEQVRKLIEQHAESFEQPEQLVRVEWAMGKMKVEDKPTDFDELMGTQKG